MPQPVSGDVHVNTPLTNISVAWVQNATNFVADKVFPIVPVEKQSDLYYEFDRGDFLRDEAKARAESSESAGSGFRLSTTSYNCRVEALHKDIDDRVRSNADSVLSLDAAATQFLAQKMAIRRDRRFATQFFTTGVWGTDSTPSNLWDTSTGTPRKDVDAGKTAILNVTGFEPNTLVMSYAVFVALRSSADVRDQFKYTSADSIDEAMLARYFGLQNLFVAKGVYNSANEGQTSTGAAIFGKHALLCYVPPAPGLMTPAAGYTFAWSGYTGAVNGMRTKKFRMENLNSDRIENEMAIDLKTVSSALGYFFNGAVS